MTFALFLVMLAVVFARPVPAQSQDPIITSAKQFSQQGNHDTAIAMLRSALTTRPNDRALKNALLSELMAKHRDLMRQASALVSEIAGLQPPPASASAIFTGGIAGCGEVPASTPVRVGGNIRQPIKTSDVKPVYPAEALASSVRGIVIMEATIDCDGNVVDARVLRGQPLLNDAALEAVKKWKYRPTLLNGVPVPVIMTVSMTFHVQ